VDLVGADLFALGSPECADAQVRKDRRQHHGNPESLMQRARSVASPGTPKILGKEEREQSEEKASHFQPENATDAPEGPQKPADATAGGAGVPVGFLLRGPNLCRGWHDPRRADRRTPSGAGLLCSLVRSLLGSLLGDASRNAYADAQPLAYLIRIHPLLSVAASKWNWFLTFCTGSRLP
jgi:hypothetical protein